ncbi:MAG TPA: DnaT-like ssDNA-binding domain-containing protein [Marinagarivorans sp.]
MNRYPNAPQSPPPLARKPIVNALPEIPLTISPSLAVQLGVEEALLVTVLRQLMTTLSGHEQQGFRWYTITEVQLAAAAPFWSARDIQRLCTNLREANVIVIASAPFSQSQLLKFAFKTAQQGPVGASVASAPPQSTSPNIIAPHWQPERDTLSQLAQHNIPDTFALNQVGEFITYWRERNEPARSWESKFFNHVIHKWRDFQTQAKQRPKVSLMHKDWRPSEDAMDVLTRHANIRREFIEDAVPEFVLYWREQGSSCDNWNRRFRDHVNRQWARYSSTLEHDTTPRRIPEGWQPSRDVYDVLRLANIDLQFAQTLIPEFVIYWRDSNQAHSSWNTRFLQYVKRRWAQRSAEAAAPNQSSTRDMSLEALVTDRSWAD